MLVGQLELTAQLVHLQLYQLFGLLALVLGLAAFGLCRLHGEDAARMYQRHVDRHTCHPGAAPRVAEAVENIGVAE